MVEYIHTQMSIWAKWSISRTSKGLGYPPVSPMFKDARLGSVYGSGIPAGICIDSLDNMHDMDKAVERLSRSHQTLVAEFYIVGGKSVEIADRLGISKKQMYENLDGLHHQVLGHLNDIAAGIS